MDQLYEPFVGVGPDDVVDEVSEQIRLERMKRLQQSEEMRRKYPDRVPVYCQRSQDSNVPDVDKNQFLVPRNLQISEFLMIIRQRIQVAPTFALHIEIDGIIPRATDRISGLFEKYAEDDGFLHVIYKAEGTFG